jgi:hypothetical protein
MKISVGIVRKSKWRWIRITCALAVVVSIVAPLPFLETVVSAFAEAWRVSSHTFFQGFNSQEVLPPAPQRTYAQRINLLTGHTREVMFSEPVTSAVIIDPDIATIEVKSNRSVLITGLATGNTILIISGKTIRTTYAIDVGRPPVVKPPKTDEERQAEQPETSSGSSSLSFTPGLDGGPSVLRYSFEYSQKLRNSRTLRLSSEMFRFFGGGDRAFTLPLGTSFGTNRLRLGLDSPTTRLDLLDSELEISRLGLNGYALRGPHFVSTSNSRWRGLEFFAGNARPQLSLFNRGEGRLAGAIIPIFQSKSFRVRSGIFLIAPGNRLEGPTGSNRNDRPKGGTVLQTDARYSSDDRTNAEGEVAYANGGFSWRARLDLQRGSFKFYGERSHIDSRSPMIAIGAQAGVHTNSAFNLQWEPNARFNAAVGYSRTTSSPLWGSRRIELNSRTFLASANFSPTRGSRLGFSFNEQVLDAPTSALVPSLLNLQTRSVVVKYDQHITGHLTNNAEARLLLSRESNSEAQMSHGFSLREQLRYTWRHGSATAFVNYRTNAPSLEGLIVRNPSLLPVEFRAAFASDPQRFLLANRDALPLLLKDVALPLTRNQESGIRIQSAFSRVNVVGEVVYSAGKFMAIGQRTVAAAFSSNLRLDAANSIQASVSRAIALTGTGDHTSLTLSYFHRFGAGSGGGFQFSKMLGIGRGRIQGRVFMDINGNGQEDAGDKGLSGMKVQLDGNKTVVTDSHGDFSFGAMQPGDFDVALISDELGVTVRASKPTVQHLSLSSNQTSNLSFGLTNSSSATGRVFNDLFLTGDQSAGEGPGLGGVRLILYPVEAAMSAPGSNPLIRSANGNGQYEFRNLVPGNYILEIDPATLPENFRLPSRTSWPIVVAPLQGFYLDIPFAAQRAITGIVFIDKDGNGRFDPEKDVVISGARVVAGKSEAMSNNRGVYLVRNLPAGKLEIEIHLPSGEKSGPFLLQLGPEPALRSNVNIMVKERE